MCCTNPHHRAQDAFKATQWAAFTPAVCGCGCMGKDHSVLRLKHYQEHLKAELKSVERQINALDEPKS
ncbi:MAG: hypothetical protein PVJ84_05765 [Desulfobacteraceae bacterium]|jgi:hypothetical protein